MPASQSDTPYLDALRAYAARGPGACTCPATREAPARTPAQGGDRGAGARARHPGAHWGIDVGEEPTPFMDAQRLAAEAWGASRTWWLVNGASQGNHVALLTLAHAATEVVTQRNAHSSTIDALVMSGLRPTFVSPELDPELHIAHCMTPEALDAGTGDARGGRRDRRLADLLRRGCGYRRARRGCARRGVPLVVDEAWGAHLAFHEDLPRPRSRSAPTSSSRASTRSSAA